MSVGCALGNRSKEQEDDINVLSEDSSDMVLFANFINFNLYDSKNINNLLIPYSSIKVSKQARLKGVRQVIFYIESRCDDTYRVKSALELWGFNSYIEYIYSICELSFLEGLIPVLDIGFLTPAEMVRLSDVVALFNIRIPSYSLFVSNPKQYDSEIKVVFKLIECACKLNIPVSLIIPDSFNAPDEYVSDLVGKFSVFQEKYHLIHDVHLKFFGDDGHYVEKDHQKYIDFYQKYKDILGPSVTVIPSVYSVSMLSAFLTAGARDFGNVPVENGSSFGAYYNDLLQDIYFDVNEFETCLIDHRFMHQQRFPLKKEFIKEQRYSSKLGQVFDSYRYKIKKDKQLKKV